MGRAEGGKLHVIGYSWPLGGSQSALAFRSTDSGYSARHDAIRDGAGCRSKKDGRLGRVTRPDDSRVMRAIELEYSGG